jgi:hypothetical protein
MFDVPFDYNIQQLGIKQQGWTMTGGYRTVVKPTGTLSLEFNAMLDCPDPLQPNRSQTAKMFIGDREKTISEEFNCGLKKGQPFC